MDEIKEQKYQEKLNARKRRECIMRAKRIAMWAVPIVIVVALVVGGIRLFSSDDIVVRSEIRFNDWVVGSDSAEVSLLVYSDFQCPACASYHVSTKQLREAFPENLRVAFRHLPIVETHSNALPAAIASEAAGRQDKFWEMHDILFERQSEWANLIDPTNKFNEYAEELGLDVAMFSGDLNDKELEGKIHAQFEEALVLGIRSVPTFFLNGELVGNSSDFEAFAEEVRRISGSN